MLFLIYACFFIAIMCQTVSSSYFVAQIYLQNMICMKWLSFHHHKSWSTYVWGKKLAHNNLSHHTHAKLSNPCHCGKCTHCTDQFFITCDMYVALYSPDYYYHYYYFIKPFLLIMHHCYFILSWKLQMSRLIFSRKLSFFSGGNRQAPGQILCT